MTAVVPVSELKQRTGKILSKAVVDRQDVIVERYGQEYAVVLSLERYHELVDAAQARVRERFVKAQRAVYEATADIPAEEVESIVADAIQASRLERSDASDS